MKKIYYTMLAIPFLSAPVSALPGDMFPQSMTSMMSDGIIYQGGILRAVLSLFIVIGLIYLTAWAYKKLNSINEKTIAQKNKKLDLNKFNVISTQTLGPNKNLHVVEINGKYLVIGSTPNSITLIKELEKAPSVANETSSQPVVNAPEQQARQQIKEEPKTVQKALNKSDENIQDILNKYKNL